MSGGSITAGVLATRWSALRFEGDVAKNLRELVILPLRAFCHRTVDVPAIGLGTLLPGRRPSDLLQAAYAEHLYGKATLQDLPDRPRFVFNATNLATGVSFRFSKPYAGDYRIGLIPEPDVPGGARGHGVERVPPFLSPVVVQTDPAAFERVRGADLFDQVAYRERLLLTDGGVYDNLGLETVWNRYETVLTSDAGAPFGARAGSGDRRGTARCCARSTSRPTSRAASASGPWSTTTARSVRKGAYWGIDTDILGVRARRRAAGAAARIRELAGCAPG